jgi:hypothetical protein
MVKMSENIQTGKFDVNDYFKNSFEDNEREWVLPENLDFLIKFYSPENVEWLDAFDFDEKLGAIYGLLIENGEDSDEIFEKCGITEF